MYELKADSWYYIASERAANFQANSLPDDVWEPGEFLHTTVDIDGKQYYVTGVEKFMINIPSKNDPYFIRHQRKHGYNHSYGLLVRELDSYNPAE